MRFESERVYLEKVEKYASYLRCGVLGGLLGLISEGVDPHSGSRGFVEDSLILGLTAVIYNRTKDVRDPFRDMGYPKNYGVSKFGFGVMFVSYLAGRVACRMARSVT